MADKIYILEYVHYDYYRFNEVIYANTDKQKVLDFIDNDKRKVPLLKYIQEPKEIKNQEIQHFHIQIFDNK